MLIFRIFRPDAALYTASVLGLAGVGQVPGQQPGNALVRYVRAADAEFRWTVSETRSKSGARIVGIDMTSQKWREHFWLHRVLLIVPKKIRNPDSALLLISGKKNIDGYAGIFAKLAEQAGAITAVVNGVPKQPLYDGKKEDALIAYTFSQYIETGDETWPLLFPMVKTVVRAMDTVQKFARKELGHDVMRFTLTGASKRGWTTYLTGAVDQRVAAMAPMVFDVLNMKVQTDWSEKVWGKQSEMIRDYTERGLVGKAEDPRMEQIRAWVDPYSYRRQYPQPKLIMLGANDPYWVVDSTRHYFRDLAEPKLIFQMPNAGHDLGGGKDAIETLGAFYQMIADRETLPQFRWRIEGGLNEQATLAISSTKPIQRLELWTAQSSNRDFRPAKWKCKRIKGTGKTEATISIDRPASGWTGYFVTADFKTERGNRYTLSTEARVVPDLLAGEQVDLSNARKPNGDTELRQWLENMVGHHGFSLDEVQIATGLAASEIQTALHRFGIQRYGEATQGDGKTLKVLPYPGGRHPRIGFLDGAINPQRETKVSVFLPWDPRSYVVVDVPEAIWSNLGLTYLAHTHVPTVWSKQGIDLPKLEWNRLADGSFAMSRELPNGIRFGSKVVPRADRVDMEMSLHNGTKEKLTGMRVQNCVMLKDAQGFSAQWNENKVMQKHKSTWV